MRYIWIVFFVIFFKNVFSQKSDYVIVVHGGAGNFTKENLSEYDQNAHIKVLDEALEKGALILENGGNALDAVEIVITILEDSPLFNAGKGAVFNSAGINELDASIMDGTNLNAGAVTCVTDIRNPISAARKVMTNSQHVMLSGKGAGEFARSQGLKIVDNSYFFTFERWSDYKALKEKDMEKVNQIIDKKGTVGCVVLDKYGNLAAGTSTGGMIYKRYNRIGDSPVIGAGTYANNATCAVSCTGHGEFFIRYSVAHDISCLMEYRNYSVEKAAYTVIHEKLSKAGASGGVIVVDKNGNIAMEFNTSGMFRGYRKSDKSKEIKIFSK